MIDPPCNDFFKNDNERRQSYLVEHKVSGNVLNVLSLTQTPCIHHFRLDGALITELCHLLNSNFTQQTSLCVTAAFVSDASADHSALSLPTVVG